MRKFDVIIVGFGLAGAALALQCLQRKKKFLVIDKQDVNSASRVAAGLFTPFTGQGNVKTWLADDIFQYLKRFYIQAEVLLDFSFFQPLPIYKPFNSIKEQNDWNAKSADPVFQNYIDLIWTPGSYGHDVIDPLGGVVISNGGILDTQAFLDSAKSLLLRDDNFCDEDFEFASLSLSGSSVRYKKLTADHIIFCEGIQVLHNSYFNWVPIRPLKGEVLEIEMDGPADRIYKQNIYVVPTGTPQVFRVGATYDRENILPGATNEARNELEIKLKELLNKDYKVTNQDWGIRPTTPDRKPVLGSHPVHKNLLLFNGLGTKGVSLAPYFSGVLLDWIDNKITLDKQVNISRFKSLYSGFE
ncbi:MAG: FAD-binding oxidoreductase [Flammeovirgaceae bacterium]|nr:FAD-binding oxidoreductase [Flammeovirgaceae bacterium]